MRQLIAVLACCGMAVGTHAEARGAEPSDLAKQCPVVTSERGVFPAIYLRGLINEGAVGKQEFRIRYERADRFSFEVIDATDGTPVVYLLDGRLVAYNAVEGGILFCDSASFHFGYGFERGRFLLRYDFGRAEDPSSISLNLGSLFERSFTREQVTMTVQGTFRVTRMLEDGTTFVSVLDPLRPFHFRQVEVTPPGAGDPRFAISEISVDRPASQAWPTFPAIDALRGNVKRREWSEESLEENTAALNFLKASLLARAAIRSEPLRRQYEDRFGTVDWDHAAKRDLTCSKLVREVIGTPR